MENKEAQQVDAKGLLIVEGGFEDQVMFSTVLKRIQNFFSQS
jgi:hypothetical protein